MTRWPDDYPDPAAVRFPPGSWNADLKAKIAHAETRPEILKAIVLPEPPDVPATRGELDAILAHASAPDYPTRAPEIRAEHAALPLSLLAPLGAQDNGPKPETRAVVDRLVKWSVPFIMYFKDRWSRPRPHHLDPTITEMVSVPGHPAYPSGHSTQAHMIAMLGAEIARDPGIAAMLMKAAARVAENREYAGLHYSSDSACGVAFARQLLPFFLADNKAQIDKAREEWP